MNGTLKFNLLFTAEKRRLDPTEWTVSIQSLTQSLNLMVTTGIVIPDQFPNENVVHPSIKDKDGNPMTVKDFRARDQ